MSEVQASEVQAEPVESEAQSDSEALGEGGKKALEAERKRAAEAERAAKELKAQLDAINDAKLTEAQRLEKQIAELQANYERSQAEAVRKSVALAEGIPASLVGFLNGSSEAEVQESARVLKAAIAEAAKPGTPVPDPSQASGGGVTAGSTAAQFEKFIADALGS